MKKNQGRKKGVCIQECFGEKRNDGHPGCQQQDTCVFYLSAKGEVMEMEGVRKDMGLQISICQECGKKIGTNPRCSACCFHANNVHLCKDAVKSAGNAFVVPSANC